MTQHKYTTESNWQILLKEWDLEEFQDQFKLNGFTDPMDWIHINQQDMAELGFKKGHILRFNRKLKSYHQTLLSGRKRASDEANLDADSEQPLKKSKANDGTAQKIAETATATDEQKRDASNRDKIISSRNIREKELHQLLSYFARLYKIESRFPKEVKVMIYDYSLFGQFHPKDHQHIRISNDGLSASNSSRNGYNTILFGFPFDTSPKSVRMQNNKYVVKVRIDKKSCDADSVGIAFVPLNYNLFNGAPDMLDGTYVIYSNGTRFGWVGNSVGERGKMTYRSFPQFMQGTIITIIVDLKNKEASIETDRYSHIVSFPDFPTKNDNDDIDTEHDIIRLAFILNSPYRDEKCKTQITVIDQYWE